MVGTKREIAAGRVFASSNTLANAAARPATSSWDVPAPTSVAHQPPLEPTSRVEHFIKIQTTPASCIPLSF